MQKNSKWWVLGIGSTCFMLLVGNGVYRFKNETMEIYNQYKLTELKEAAEHQVEFVQRDFQSKINLLNALSEKAMKLNNITIDTILEDLQFVALSDDFNYVGISDIDGNAIDSAGNSVNISDRSYFKEILNGKKASISNVMQSSVIVGDAVQIIAVPMMKDHQLKGLIYGVHTLGAMKESLDHKSTTIYSAIVDANGVPLTVDEGYDWLNGHSHLAEFYDESEFIESSYEEVQNNIKQGKSGYYIIKHHDEERLTYYTPLKIEGYYIYSNLDISFMEEMITKIEAQTQSATIDLLIALAVFVTTISLFSKMIFTQQKLAYENIVSNEKLMQLALQNSEIFLFEYDPKKHQLKKKTNQPYLIFTEDTTENVAETLIDHEVFHKKDYSALKTLFETIDYKENVKLELQTTPVFGSQWLEIYMKNIYDTKNRRLNTIGWIKNISDIKEQEARAHHHQLQAQRDGLTGLYNSTTAIGLINDILSSSEGKHQKHLLIFMDLDNFKKINDTFGHQFGNDVLIDLASAFAHTFRKTDIVGRFGGDEFFAFLTDVVSFPEMEHIFKELVSKCERIYEQDGIEIPVSASFGIALAPDHGEDFETLAKKADEMLLAVKKEGKNRYRVYGFEGDEIK